MHRDSPKLAAALKAEAVDFAASCGPQSPAFEQAILSNVKIILNTDAKTASKITGKSIDVIYTYRSKLGIGRVSKYRRWTKEEDVMLGTMSDFQLAKIIKRSPCKVQRRRSKLGIEPFNQQNEPYPDWNEQEKMVLLLTINQIRRPRYGKRLRSGSLLGSSC